MKIDYLNEYKYYKNLDWDTKAYRALDLAVKSGEPMSKGWYSLELFKRNQLNSEEILKIALECEDIELSEKVLFDSLLKNKLLITLVESMSKKGHEEARLILKSENQSCGDKKEVYLDDSIKLKLSKNVLGKEEISYLLSLAKPYFEPSTVIDPKSGLRILDPVRSGLVAKLMPENQGLFGLYIQRKLCLAQNASIEQAEMLNIIEYGKGEQYKSHYDGFSLESNGVINPLIEGGQRVKTGITCLKKADEGGATRFGLLKRSVLLDQGDEVSFLNADENGNILKRSLHSGLPVTRGTKVIATQWVRSSTTTYFRKLKALHV